MSQALSSPSHFVLFHSTPWEVCQSCKKFVFQLIVDNNCTWFVVQNLEKFLVVFQSFL